MHMGACLARRMRSPNIMRYLAVWSAAWGANGYPSLLWRTPSHPQAFRSRSARWRPASPHFHERPRRVSAVHDTEEEVDLTGMTVKGAGLPTGRDPAGKQQRNEATWLGNGPDPMAAARSSLPENLAAAARRGGCSARKGGHMEEVWLNGPFKAPRAPEPVEVLHVDEHIVVVNKPSGILCVPGRLEKDSLATRVALQLGHYRVDRMIVHRLDMATSGVVVMARSDAALKDLNRQFRDREVRKRYVAMVHGYLPAEEGEVDLPLCRNTGCPPLHMVNFEYGKPSLTQWRVLARAADRTRVEMIPVSGRSHQLRLHMDAIGHPVLGDHFYGTKESLALADRCLLHAQSLGLRHPITGEACMFTAPCEF